MYLAAAPCPAGDLQELQGKLCEVKAKHGTGHLWLTVRGGKGGFQLELTTCGFSPCKPMYFSIFPRGPRQASHTPRPCEDELHCCSAACSKPPASHHAPNTGIHQELPSPGQL